MNVYDFDKTIYQGDSTLDFYKSCVKRYPSILFCLPKQIWALFLYKTKKTTKTVFKEKFYCFLNKIKDIDTEIVLFWDVYENKIQPWYVGKKQVDDIIISASPEFLLREICNRLDIKVLIASIVNKNTGEYTGENCYGLEKLKRFKKLYNDQIVENFYTDSKSDRPMAEIAQSAYLVNGNKIELWMEV